MPLDDIRHDDPATDDARSAAFADALLDQGYLILPQQLAGDALDRLYAELDPHFRAARYGNGYFYGGETKRFGSVLRRSQAAQALALEPVVSRVVERVLGGWCQCLQLNLTQAIEIHPGAPAQAPHRDQDMWGGPKGAMHYMVNAMWALDDFTVENGATRIWPGSHRADPDALLDDADAVPGAMPRGSVLLFLGSTLHSGGANFSSLPRRGLIISYCLGWLKPWENQWLAYPPAVARGFDRRLAALVGYRQHLPSLGNYEGQCPSVLLDDGAGDYHPFTDALRPDQLALARDYHAQQSAIVRERVAAAAGAGQAARIAAQGADAG